MTGLPSWPQRLFVITVALALALFSFAHAPDAAAQQPAPNRPLAVVLLVDNSGSMAASDSDGLRWSAAQLFIDLATPGDRIAAIAFSSGVDPLGSAAAGRMETIADQASRTALKALLTLKRPEGETNMNEALRTAARLLQREAANTRPVIVLLTDGKPEPAAQIPALNAIIRELGAEGVLTFPILLGSNIDPESANLMVKETGALRQDVATAAGLLEAFGRIYAYVQPERYVDELQLGPGQRLTFQTNLAQAVTDVAVIVPRREANGSGLQAASLDGADLLAQPALAHGGRAEFAEGIHYQLVRVTHNAPITGEWGLVPAARGTGLLIVKSHVVFELPHPAPSVAGSFVSPRLIPAGRPLFLAARVRRADSLLADEHLSVVNGDQASPLTSAGLSAQRDFYWKFLALPSLPAGATTQLELQVGSELTPFRLRKSFVVGAIAAPPLVVDSPSAADGGLRPGSRLGLAAHFGAGATNPTITAYVVSDQAGTVDVVPLSCTGLACADESITVEPGRTYRVLFRGEAAFQGQRYSDASQVAFASGDVIRIDGLERAAQLGTLLPDSPAPALPLTITAFVQAGPPKLAVRLHNMHPALPAAYAGQAVALLSPLAPVGNSTYRAEMTLRGLETLPPNTYTAELQFQPDTGAVVTPAATQVRFQIPEAGLAIDGLAELAALNGVLPGVAPRSLPLVVTAYAVTGLPQLSARLINLSPAPPTAQQVSAALTTLSPAGQRRYTTQLTLSGLERLPPNSYTAEVLLESPTVQVSPALTQFAFEVKQSAAVLQRITEPPASELCPQDSALARPRNLIDFGVLQGEMTTRQVDLYFSAAWLPPGPFNLGVMADPLRRSGSAQAASDQSRLALGAAERAADGTLRIPLRLELPPDLPPGRYVQTIRLSSTETNVEPQTYDVTFYRPSFAGTVAYATQPARCLIREWYALAPHFPRIKGIISWLVTLVVLGLIVSSIRALRGDEPAAFAVTGPDGATLALPGGCQAYVIIGPEGGLQLSHRAADAGRAIVVLAPEMDDLEADPAVSIMPGAQASTGVVSYYSPLKLRWFKLTAKGRRPHGGEQFRVRSGAVKSEYTVDAIL